MWYILISGFNNVFAVDITRIAIQDFEANDKSKFTAKDVTEFICTEKAKKNNKVLNKIVISL